MLTKPLCVAAVLLVSTSIVLGNDLEIITASNAPPIQPIEKAPTKRQRYSPELAARYLDVASLNWQKDRKCVTCHTNMAYLMSRPALSAALKDSGEVRTFYEKFVNEQSSGTTGKPRVGDYRPVVAATGLVFNDLQTEGRLSLSALTALKLMWQTQRDDGGWSWAKCGWAPMEIDDHYGVSLAALTVGVAPENYRNSSEAREGVAKIRQFLSSTPPKSLHHRMMLLWASKYIDSLLTKEQQRVILKEVIVSQLSDGGWSTAQLLSDWKEFKRKDNAKQTINESDAYATGLAISLAREFGYAAESPLIQPATAWLTRNQDTDGKWFTRSPSKDSQQFFTNIGTAFAILGLQASGELPGWPFTSEELLGTPFTVE